jgi:hypothetical protein
MDLLLRQKTADTIALMITVAEVMLAPLKHLGEDWTLRKLF